MRSDVRAALEKLASHSSAGTRDLAVCTQIEFTDEATAALPAGTVAGFFKHLAEQLEGGPRPLHEVRRQTRSL